MAVEKNCWERAATQKADFQRQNKDLSRRSKLKITLRSLAVNKWTSFQLIYYFLVSLFVQWHTWLRKISRNDIDAIFTVIQFAWSWPKFTCFEKKYKQFHTHTHTQKRKRIELVEMVVHILQVLFKRTRRREQLPWSFSIADPTWELNNHSHEKKRIQRVVIIRARKSSATCSFPG